MTTSTCKSPQIFRPSNGYSLLEVMIALLVFSIGLLGLGAMLVSAVKGNHQAYHHSQAVMIAQAMADGLRANLIAVHAGNYDVALTGTHTGPDCAGGCTPAQIANRDLAQWADMASGRLPDGQIGIACTRLTLPAGPLSSSYNGICRLQVAWGESGDVGQQAAASQRMFSWMVQP